VAGTKTLLMMCASLGLGNSTRLMGVAQAIRRRFCVPPEKLRLVICAAGKAARYWNANAASVQAEVVALDEYVFSGRRSQSRVRWSGFIRPCNAAACLRNNLRLRALLSRVAVDLALIDSDYHFLPLHFAGVPIAALGQARDVARRCEIYRRGDLVPPRSLFIEKLDFQVQRLVSRFVLVPCFEPGAARDGKVTDIPLIVREEFTASVPPAGTVAPLYIMTGGSGIGAAPLLEYARRYGLTVIWGASGPAEALDNEGRPLIDRAGAVLVQGGLSSISECIARRKKMIVFPIAGHGEQLANAITVERLGLGLRVAQLSAPPFAFLERLRLLSAKTSEPVFPRVDGAQAAAGILLKTLGLIQR